MKMKAIIFFILIVIFLVSSMAVVAAQSSATSPVSVTPTTLSFVGKENQPQLTRNLTIIGITNQAVTITLVPTDLYDNNSGKTIYANDIEITPSTTFNLSANQTIVNISINTSQTKSGTYQGTIIVTTTIYNSTTNNLQITATNIGVSAIIQPGISFFFSVQLGLIIFIIALEVITFYYPNEWRFKNLVVVVFGGIILSIWVSMLLFYGFSPTNSILSTIGTIVIVPFFAWVIGYVNDKRTTENEKEKSARTIENDGNKNDIDIIRNILGELETHFASFKPDLYRKPEDNRRTSLKILYNESGIISRKVWDTSCRQGVMSDLPLLELEKYYSFVNIYNRYYSCAIELTKDKNKPPVKEYYFIKSFEKFRSDYAELETVLYVNLSYYMGLFVKTNLSPLPIEFPRITRILLKRLIDYDILDATKYPGNFKDPGYGDSIKYSKEFLEKLSRKSKEKKEFKEESDEVFLQEFMKENIEKYMPKNGDAGAKEELLEAVKKEAKRDKYLKWVMKDKFKKQVDSGAFDKWKKDKLSREAKKRIDEWHISAAGLENIFNEIYHRDNVPLFYKAVGDDFETKFSKLASSVGKLLPIPREFLEKEKKSASMKETKTIKELSEELDAIKKLLNANELTNEEYEKIKASLQKKIKAIF